MAKRLKRKLGRPTAYDPERHPVLAHALAELGKTEVEVANLMGIGKSTLTLWKKRYPAFLASLKEGRLLPDAQVTQSLFRRATGFDYIEEARTFGLDATGQPFLKRIVRTQRHLPGDPTAIIFWLKNRRPDLWREKVDHQQVVKVGGPGDAEAEKPFDHDRYLAAFLAMSGAAPAGEHQLLRDQK